MDARRAKEVEGQRGLREKTVPLSEGKLGVNGTENGHEVIFERADGTLSGVNAVFFRGNTLELNLVLGEGVLEVLRALVV
jgi:hypothetical protein